MKRTLVERVAEKMYEAAAIGLCGTGCYVKGWHRDAKTIIAMVRRHDRAGKK